MSNLSDDFTKLFERFAGIFPANQQAEQETREKAQRECDAAIGRRVRVRAGNQTVTGTITECAFKMVIGSPRYVYKLRVGDRVLTLKSARIPSMVKGTNN